MPFINEIINYIDATLKAGALNKKKLQPGIYNGLSTVVARQKATNKKVLELLPGKVTAAGKGSFILPDDKIAFQSYHKLLSNVYSLDKKGQGDFHYMNSVTEISQVVYTNNKLTGLAKEALEPVVVFGMPQKLSGALIADLQINSCLITVLGSNLDHIAVFRQEFPQSDYFFNESMSLFSIRYRITMQFSQKCVDQCLCG